MKYTEDQGASEKVLKNYRMMYEDTTPNKLTLINLEICLRRYTASSFGRDISTPGVLSAKEIFKLMKSSIHNIIRLIHRVKKHPHQLVSYYSPTIISARYPLPPNANVNTRRYLQKVLRDMDEYREELSVLISTIIRKLKKFLAMESTSQEMTLNKIYLEELVEEVFSIYYLITKKQLLEAVD